MESDNNRRPLSESEEQAKQDIMQQLADLITRNDYKAASEMRRKLIEAHEEGIISFGDLLDVALPHVEGNPNSPQDGE